MSFFDLFKFGNGSRLSEAEESLGAPVKAEGKSLALHVEKCAQRWSVLVRQNNALNDRVTQIWWLLLIIAALSALNASTNLSDLLLMLFRA
jgi:hypothetical protein